MAIINVETPQGIVKVEIAGDQPTQQEADAIRSQFFGTQRRDLTFDDLLEDFGFVEVQEPEFGDLIFFKVYNSVPNHCGIYLEEDIFMHHAINRLSCRESFYPLWINKVSRYVRYAKS